MNSFSLPSFAKINLALEILHRRPDGFHEIRTLYQTVDLHDTLHFSLSRRELTLEIEGADLGDIEANLVLRAARLLSSEARVTRGARIRLEKRIPVQAGLGGGSSNGAVALLGLNLLWGLKFGLSRLLPLAQQLGSDVPFFLFGGAAFGWGRGEQLISVELPSMRAVVIVHPGVAVSTPEAYHLLGRQLTAGEGKAIISRLCLMMSSGPWGPARGFNDFEAPIFGRYPEIQKVRDQLLKHGALAAQMSGSGSAVYGIFPDRKLARQALSRIEQHPWKAYLVKTVDQASYRRAVASSATSG